MWFFGELLIHGMLSGSVYALISLAFVVVYKASRMMNFALGESIMLASKLVATGRHALGLGHPVDLYFRWRFQPV
jgi:branched-chain amino acid transport system permease protein